MIIDETMKAVIDENSRLASEARRLWCSIPVVRKLEAIAKENADLNEQFRQLVIDFMRMEQRLQVLENPSPDWVARMQEIIDATKSADVYGVPNCPYCGGEYDDDNRCSDCGM